MDLQGLTLDFKEIVHAVIINTILFCFGFFFQILAVCNMKSDNENLKKNQMNI